MATNWTTPMEWQNEGTEPSTELKQTGYKGKDKPAATTFNYFLNKTAKCIVELQRIADEITNSISKHIANNVNSTAVHGMRVIEGKFRYQSGSTWIDTAGQSNDINGEIFNDYTNNSAMGAYAHAQNYNNSASAYCAHAGGENSSAQGTNSLAHGTNLIAEDYQTIFGKNNLIKTGMSDPNSQTSTEALFSIGYGTDTTRANALTIYGDGRCKGVAAFLSSGADYAEYFEWSDGNPDNEDRRGRFVTLDGDKIQIANEGDFVIGVISASPCFVGNTQSEEWQGKYLVDVFGEKIFVDVEIPEQTDKETGKVIPAHTVKQLALNPDYNPEQEYVPREYRQEWAAVGMIGQIIVIDDGTCEVNGYCTVAEKGIATKATGITSYRVMSRIDENHIKILVK